MLESSAQTKRVSHSNNLHAMQLRTIGIRNREQAIRNVKNYRSHRLTSPNSDKRRLQLKTKSNRRNYRRDGSQTIV